MTKRADRLSGITIGAGPGADDALTCHTGSQVYSFPLRQPGQQSDPGKTADDLYFRRWRQGRARVRHALFRTLPAWSRSRSGRADPERSQHLSQRRGKVRRAFWGSGPGRKDPDRRLRAHPASQNSFCVQRGLVRSLAPGSCPAACDHSLIALTDRGQRPYIGDGGVFEAAVMVEMRISRRFIEGVGGARCDLCLCEGWQSSCGRSGPALSGLTARIGYQARCAQTGSGRLSPLFAFARLI